MQARPTRWECSPYEVAVAERLAAGLGMSRIAATILARRGFADVEEARRFLAAAERHDPLELPGAAAAGELILGHVRRGTRIAVFGDYDVDGVCSTAMLVRALRAAGADPLWELPSRFDEGYGLSAGAVERLAARGVGLLVTVDCGITAVEPVAAARAAGLDVVISDHHRPGPELPDCVAGAPRARRGLRLSGAVRLGRGAEARARRCGRWPATTRVPRRRTSTWPRSPPSATSCRCAARTAASCARACSPSHARASRGCAR